MQRWMENNIRINDPDNKEVVINKSHSKEALKEVEDKVEDSSELIESFNGLLMAVKT
jgi:translation initiation factor 2B subunit (eIF-2B alpha/beta/delta family)